MQNQSLSGFRLSTQQSRLWLAQQDRLTFISQVMLKLESRLDARIVRDAVTDLVQRHEILRTTFHRRAGMKVPLQVVNADCRIDWRTIDGFPGIDPANGKRGSSRSHPKARSRLTLRPDHYSGWPSQCLLRASMR